MIAAVEKDFITRGVDRDIRADGRSRLDCRPFTLTTGLIPQSSGSCRVTIEGGTDVLVGVKVELGSIEPGHDDDGAGGGGGGGGGGGEDSSDAPYGTDVSQQRRNRGRVVCTVECSPASMKMFDSRDIEEMCSEYSEMMNRVYNGNHGGLDLQSLCIIPENTCWVIYIDALILDYAGNLLDAIFFAARGAIHNTLIPKCSVEESAGHYEFAVTDEETEILKGRENVPVAITMCKIGSRHVLDPSPLEEFCSEGRLTVAVNPQGNLCAVQKGGSGGIEPSLLFDMIQEGKRHASAMLSKIRSLLLEEDQRIERGEDSVGFFNSATS